MAGRLKAVHASGDVAVGVVMLSTRTITPLLPQPPSFPLESRTLPWAAGSRCSCLRA